MTFLPVAERELRVATRRPATYRLRLVAALVAMLIGAGLLVLHGLAAMPAGQLGSGLFGILTWLAFIGCSTAGVFLTSDTISEEKREGTLGFLLLTDLGGLDIIMGKLAATSLRGAYALLAIFPILGITLVLGGVGGKQFWQTALALVLILGISLAAGLLASTIARRTQAAVSGTVLLLVLLYLAGPLADFLLRVLTSHAEFRLLSASSPGFLFLSATRWNGVSYGLALLCNVALMLGLFALGSYLIPRTWNRAERQGRATPVRRTERSDRARMRMRRMLDVNPMVWLAARDRSLAAGAWLLCSLVIIVFAIMAISRVPAVVWMGWGVGSGIVVLLLYVWVASHSSRMMNESRHSGLLELLLSTPLTTKEIIDGQWKAFVRSVVPPVALILVLNTIGGALGSTFTMKNAATQAPNMQVSVNFAGMLIATAVASLGVMGNLIAICWFGMWAGLTSRTNNQAMLKTLLFVQVAPWFIISFVSGIATMLLFMPQALRGAGNPSAMTFNLSIFQVLAVAVPGSLAITKDLLFIFWSKRRLVSQLRERVINPGQNVAPWSGSNLPPVIPVSS